MNITRVNVVRVAPNALGLVIAADIESDDLIQRAAPFVVKFGDVRALSVFPLPGRSGVRAIFEQMPVVGSALAVGYSDIGPEDTSFRFSLPNDEPVA
jgi:hypothetical protein